MDRYLQRLVRDYNSSKHRTIEMGMIQEKAKEVTQNLNVHENHFKNYIWLQASCIAVDYCSDNTLRYLNGFISTVMKSCYLFNITLQNYEESVHIL